MQQAYSPHLQLAKTYWKEHLRPHDLVIDATCGNGHDTLFLSEICQVVGLDIQAEAIQNTEALLDKHQKKAVLHRISHEKIDELPLPGSPRLIVYNLGYLPSADKNLTTLTETTLNSVQKSLELLERGGALSIMCYPGHPEGEKEEVALLEFVSALPSHEWLVCHHRWINRVKAPSFLWIRKI